MKRIIEIKGLSLMAHIGVPEEERIQAQKLLVDVRFAALLQPEELNLKTGLENSDFSQYTLPQKVFSKVSRTVKVCHGFVKTILKQTPYEISSSSNPVFRLKDDLSATVDYAAVSQRIEEIAQERPRRLIETLADEMTAALLTEFQLAWVELRIRKFILSNTEYVAVTVSRRAAI